MRQACKMGIMFFGTGRAGVACLKALLDEHYFVLGVCSKQGDDVEHLAQTKQIPIFRGRPGAEVLSFVDEHAPEIFISVNYPYLLSADFLRLAKTIALNIHGSLLPHYRGRTPNTWAMINGETQTGVTVHVMEPEVDAGPILSQVVVPIYSSDTSQMLLDRMLNLYPQLLIDTLARFLAGHIQMRPQQLAGTTIWPKRTPDMGKIDWHKSSIDLYNWVRALSDPYPGAFTTINEKRMFVWKADVISGVDCEDSERVPGKILARVGGTHPERGGVIVTTGQGYLLLRVISFEGEEKISAETLECFVGQQFV